IINTKQESIITKQETMITTQEPISIKQEPIDKPALASLNYSHKTFPIDKIYKLERQLFSKANIEHINTENNSNLQYLLPIFESEEDNKSLPPFRKYSIPKHINKTDIKDLK
ncbi:MAG: hypothetical protein FWG85_07820, partial [Bacteroidetes bacterium]|nr:hypothetical protein [Bacteroidota bacterium]